MKVNKEELRKLIAEVLEMEAEDIDDETDFNKDLAINSLQMLDMVAEIEDNYDLIIEHNEIRNMTNINKIAEALEKRI
ncbi:MAG: acyl carrier protein [Ruminococcus sp.]|nr:acyl carrier protein [Ruminococcus sp.]